MNQELDTPNTGADAVQEHPEQSQEDSGYGERNAELPDQLVNALKELVKEFQQNEQFVRRREVLRDRRNRFYDKGYQHIHENAKSGTFVQMQAGASYTNAAGESANCPNYIDDYNVFAPCVEILESTLTSNPPGVDFRPISPNITEDIDAASTAEAYRKMFDRSNNAKSIQMDVVRMMALSGRTVIWTRTEANGQKFGFDDEGNPHRMETATVYGTLESRVPVLAKAQDDVIYCFLFDDPDTKQAKEEYPEFADKIKPNMGGLGESAYERMARLGVLQGTRQMAQMGDSFNHVVTRSHCWLRPACFNGEALEEGFSGANASEIGENDEIPTVKDKLKQIFPSGAHIVFIGDVYVGSWDESMDDALTIGFPMPGDGMSRPAIMDRAVIIQDRFNDDRNAYAECKDMGWPSTWINAEDYELDAIVDQKADPYAIRGRKARNGMPMEQEFFREPDPELPATFVQDTQALLELLYFVLATPPALFGEGETDQKTAAGFAQMKQQALGRLGLIWGEIERMMAQMYKQAALCAAENPDHSDQITIPGDDGTAMTVSLANISKGKFGAYADQDGSFPESTSAKRQTLIGLVTMAAQTPVGMQMFQSPDNWELINQLMGMPELVLPEAVSRDKQLAEIELLLEQSPIPPDPNIVAQMQMEHATQTLVAGKVGQPAPPFAPPPPQCSIPVNELDFHPWEFEKCKEWLSSKECRDQVKAGNQAGVDNIRLHAKQHQMFMEEQAPPPMPPMPMGHGKGPMPAPPPPQMGAPDAPSALAS